MDPFSVLVSNLNNIGFYNFIIRTDFRAVGGVWQVFSKYNPAISHLFIKLMVLKGFFIIAIGSAIFYLSIYLLKSGIYFPE